MKSQDLLKAAPPLGRGFTAVVEIRSFKVNEVSWLDKQTGDPRKMRIQEFGAEFVEDGTQLVLRDTESRDGKFLVDGKDFPKGSIVMVTIRQLEGGGRTSLQASIAGMAKLQS